MLCEGYLSNLFDVFCNLFWLQKDLDKSKQKPSAPNQNPEISFLV